MTNRDRRPRPATRLPAARRRKQLLDVALEVFAERGFHPTSMNDLAEAAGVTKPVLYQHFGSKRELYLELLDDVGGRLRDAIGKATSEAAGAPGAGRARASPPTSGSSPSTRPRSRCCSAAAPGATRSSPPRPPGRGRRSPSGIAALIEVAGLDDDDPPAARPRHRRAGRGHQPALAARRRHDADPESSPPASPSSPGPACAASALVNWQRARNLQPLRYTDRRLPVRRSCS